MTAPRSLACVLLVAVLATPTMAQTSASSASTAPASVTIRRTDGTTGVLTIAQIAALPHSTISTSMRGVNAQFSGVPLTALLTAAAIAPVDSLTGLRLRVVVLVSGVDGYKVAFSMAELDRTIGRRQVLVADKQDGQPIRAGDGPLRLIVPEDGRPARWVRGITTIDLVYTP
jgi:hypothetical protein